MALMLGLVSCGSGDNKKKDDASKQPLPVAGDVYVAGDANNVKPTLWKNGSQTSLGISGSCGHGYSNSVFVSGNDVYVAGYDDATLPVNENIDNETKPRATLWKNGVSQRLSEFPSVAHSVYVSNGNVYVAGAENNTGETYGTSPVLWIIRYKHPLLKALMTGNDR